MPDSNRSQAEAWNGDSGARWVEDADRRDAVLAPIGDLLLQTAAIRAGERVLDVGCGCGATTLAAAQLTGTGTVTGVDLSHLMIQKARERGAALPSCEFRVADVQTDDLGLAEFDVAISRFGTMFFDDPAAAFTNVARSVRPGGRACFVTWSGLAANPWLLRPAEILQRYEPTALDQVAASPMFSQAQPEAVDAMLTDAGWSAIDIVERRLSLPLGPSPTDAADYLAGTGSVRQVLASRDAQDRASALDLLTDMLAGQGRGPDVQMDACVLVCAAERRTR